jgi:hypothetical protein
LALRFQGTTLEGRQLAKKVVALRQKLVCTQFFPFRNST